MKLKNSVQAAVAVAALTIGVSGAQAQYNVMAPVASGSAVTLPYGGYYGPAIAPTPIITSGVPFYSPSIGGYGVGNYDTNVFGYGDYGFNASGNNAFGFTGVGDVTTPQSGVRSVNGTEVQGGIVDPTAPEAAPSADGTPGSANPAAKSQQNSTGSRAALNLVVARRAPYNRVDITYRGDTSNANSVTMMLLDRRGRELQQEVLTSLPAETQLRVPIGTRYYRVIVSYNDGTTRTFTRTLNVKPVKSAQ